jgi:hypothetical protein
MLGRRARRARRARRLDQPARQLDQPSLTRLKRTTARPPSSTNLRLREHHAEPEGNETAQVSHTQPHNTTTCTSFLQLLQHNNRTGSAQQPHQQDKTNPCHATHTAQKISIRKIEATAEEPQRIVTARSLCHLQYRGEQTGGQPGIYPNEQVKWRSVGARGRRDHRPLATSTGYALQLNCSSLF